MPKRTGGEESDEPRSAERRLWGGLLAVAGAAAGLAALVYLIGAATVWLALRNRGYSPDIAIEHQSKSQLIGIGLRGVFVVGGLAFALAVVAALLVGGRRLVPSRPGVVGVDVDRVPAAWEPVLPRFATGVVLRVGAAAVAAGLLVGASLASWRWLAVAIPASTLLLSTALRMWHWPIFLVAAVLTAVAWQYGGPVYVTSVVISPTVSGPVVDIHYFPSKTCLGPDRKPASFYGRVRGKEYWIREYNKCGDRPQRSRTEIIAELRSCDYPYFGQSGGFVYLGAITNVYQEADGRCFWDAGPIVERRRDKIRLRYLRGKASLNPPAAERRTPMGATWEALGSFLEKLD